MKNKPLKDIVKKPGSFTHYAEENHESMSEAIQKGEHSKNPLTRKRAFLANTFRHLNKRRKAKGGK